MGVGDDQAVSVGDAGDGRQVGVVAGGGDQRRGSSGELGQRRLHVGMQPQRPGHQPGRARPRPPVAGGFLGCGDDAGVPREPQIVVSGQVDHWVVGAAGGESAYDARGHALLGLLVQPVTPGRRHEGGLAEASTAAAMPVQMVAMSPSVHR